MNNNINKEHDYIQLSTDFNHVNIEVQGADIIQILNFGVQAIEGLLKAIAAECSPAEFMAAKITMLNHMAKIEYPGSEVKADDEGTERVLN
jgi:hypothetical protein|uniref:Uncharacterized protein n=1 Tax=Siphoviridae sp. ctwNf2 TaxID=2827597 RepID=A0A8S5RQZ4_9CAUD|nr:MAG TPA: hypothetical protein [Siphoviridae sp. ctwNf2]